jgi:hypothetical protein
LLGDFLRQRGILCGDAASRSSLHSSTTR